MVLRTNFKAFKVVSSEKKFSKTWNFLTFFAYPGSQISWKMTNYFFERYWPEICRGLHKWCCKRILRHFRLFRAKKIFFWELAIFLLFFAYPGSKISWKMANYFFEKYRPEICCGLHKWCCKQILRHLRLFRGKKICFKNWRFLDFFCISGVTDFSKNDQRLFWEISTGNLSWTAQMVLRTNFKAFWVVSSEKIFFEGSQIFDFFAYPGSQISWKMTNFFFERYGPEIFRGLHKWCCERILRRFRSFRAKKIFSKVASFLTFFAYPGSQISWKMTNFFFERCRPEICRGLHKWCCERIWRCFRSFREKKNFQRLPIFWLFLHIRGHRFLEKWLTTFLQNTGLKFVVDCTNGVANEL